MSANASGGDAFSQGVAALDAGDYATAERILQGVVERNPRAHNAWLALAVVAMRSGAPDIAVARAQRAVELESRNAVYISNLGIAYAELGNLAAAERAFRRALRIEPAYAAAHYNLAKVLHKNDKLEDSLVEYERAHALDPRSIPIQVGLCGMYRLRGQPERALALLRRVAGPLPPALGPHFAECISDVEGPEAAVAWLRGEIARQPDAQPLHNILAMLLLSLGHWREGWKHHLWRKHAAPQRIKPVAPLPAELNAKRVLLRAEQGLGDVLFFLRFAPELRDRGATVTLECPPKLAPILADQITIYDGAKCDVQLWIADLPSVLETTAVPPAVKLSVAEDRRSRTAERLERLGRPPFLGLTWEAGSNVLRRPEYGTDLAVLFKRISPGLLGKALRGWPGTLVSLQRNPVPADLEALNAAAGATVHDLSALNEDLAEALAVLAELDQYVAVSNTNIHLLAGLGRTARVLVPHPPEWRWMREGSSPWFPGFPIYRQSSRHDWTLALERLREDLFSFAGSPRRAPA